MYTCPARTYPLAPTDKTLAAPETPGCSGEATIASKSAGVAAGEQVLAGHVYMLFPLRVNANSVRHGSDSTKGPAGAATALVSDLTDCWTLCHFSLGSKFSGTP